jgi:hypothetical protein
MTYLPQMLIWTRIAHICIQDSEECLRGVDKGIVWRCLAYFFSNCHGCSFIVLPHASSQVFNISEVTISDDIVTASVLQNILYFLSNSKWKFFLFVVKFNITQISLQQT